MNQAHSQTIGAALERCAAEPIHRPGTIQPHGMLIAADEHFIIRHVSENLGDFLPMAPEKLLGENLADVLGDDFARQLLPLSFAAAGDVALLPVALTLSGAAGLTLQGSAHFSKRTYVVELEAPGCTESPEFLESTFAAIHEALVTGESGHDLAAYLAAVVSQVADLTGFDHVMVYRFDGKWDGEVIAEQRAPGVESYLGNHFPAADIPPQARDLYTRNRLRTIADVKAAPVALLALPETPWLDMSYSTLRSFSPVHVEYLSNMGVGASLSISLLSNGRLWGLIACHHRGARVLSGHVRELADFVGRTVSLRISEIEVQHKAALKTKAQESLDAISTGIADNLDLDATLSRHAAGLLAIAGACGAVVCIGHRKYHLGRTPDVATLYNLTDWVAKMAPMDVYFTDALPESFPPAAKCHGIASGLLVAPVDAGMENYIMWFRPEVIESIPWAGNPEKIVEQDADGLRISPRKSFSTWVQSYSGHSSEWTRADVEVIEALSFALIARINERRIQRGGRALEMFADNQTLLLELDAEMRYRWISPNCEDILGYTPAELIGHTLTDFAFASDTDALRHAFANRPAHGAPNLQFRHARKDGRYLWLDLRGGNQITGNDPDSLTLIARDVTERQHFKEVLDHFSQRHLRILDAAVDGLLVLDAMGVAAQANEAAQRLLAPGGRPLAGRDFCREHCQRRSQCDGSDCPLDSAPLAGHVKLAVRRDDGETLTLQARVFRLDGEGGLRALLFRDATATPLDEPGPAPGTFVTDRNGRILSANDAFTAITGYAAEEAVGRTPAILRSNVHGREFYHNFWRRLAAEGYWRGEIWNRRKNGEIYPQRGSIFAITGKDAQISHYVATFQDDSRNARNDEKNHHLPDHDPLTGLPNRLSFEKAVSRMLHASGQVPQALAVAVIDLDNFSAINDALGHVAGDRLLYLIAARLRAETQSLGLLAHWGGDKFVLLLSDIDGESATEFAMRGLIAALQRPYSLMGRDLVPKASVGISLYPRDGGDADTLMHAADTAMNQAKAEGVGGIRIFSADLTTRTRNRFEIANDLRRGMLEKQIFLVYQPQILAHTGQVAGLEALVRWRHPERGLVPPAEFIPVAEETGLQEELGAEIFRMACAQIRAWRAAGPFNTPVGINVSPKQLNAHFPDFVRETLAAHDIPPELIEIEVTESALKPTPEIRNILHALKAIGVHLAIDDFGTGYSSLSHLKLFPFDRLKIDKSFVDGLPSNADDVAIGQAIIALGQALRVNVLAEGVEMFEQAQFLSAEGVDVIQGFYFSRPLLSEDVLPFVKKTEKNDAGS